MYFFYVIIFNDGFQAIFGNKMNKYHKKIISVSMQKQKIPRAVFRAARGYFGDLQLRDFTG